MGRYCRGSIALNSPRSLRSIIAVLVNQFHKPLVPLCGEVGVDVCRVGMCVCLQVSYVCVRLRYELNRLTLKRCKLTYIYSSLQHHPW